jgi:hypothetical protein
MDQAEKKIGYWPVVAIGIGGMVGGGIFAVLGLSVQMTQGAAPLAFLAAGLVASGDRLRLHPAVGDLSRTGRHRGFSGPGVWPGPFYRNGQCPALDQLHRHAFSVRLRLWQLWLQPCFRKVSVRQESTY